MDLSKETHPRDPIRERQKETERDRETEMEWEEEFGGS